MKSNSYCSHFPLFEWTIMNFLNYTTFNTETLATLFSTNTSASDQTVFSLPCIDLTIYQRSTNVKIRMLKNLLALKIIVGLDSDHYKNLFVQTTSLANFLSLATLFAFHANT